MRTGVPAGFSAASLNGFVAVELKFDSGTVFLWDGLRDLTIDGNVYTGAGTLLSVSQISEDGEISAKGVSIGLSGIDATILSYALTELYTYRPMSIYVGTVDVLERDDYGLITATADEFVDMGFITSTADEFPDYGLIVYELVNYYKAFSGRMDVMSIVESGETANITLTCESRLIDLERPRVRRWTSEDQKSLYPGDLGFDFLNGLQEKEIVWKG